MRQGYQQLHELLLCNYMLFLQVMIVSTNTQEFVLAALYHAMSGTGKFVQKPEDQKHKNMRKCFHCLIHILIIF